MKQKLGFGPLRWLSVLGAVMLFGVNQLMAQNNWADLSNRNASWPSGDPKYISGNEYRIFEPEDMAQFAHTVNTGNTYAGQVVKLMGNIDLSQNWWTPAGTNRYTHFFSGMFDGNHKTISGLRINDHNPSDDRGLFGNVKGTEYIVSTPRPQGWPVGPDVPITFYDFSGHYGIASVVPVVIQDLTVEVSEVTITQARTVGVIAGFSESAEVCNVSTRGNPVTVTLSTGFADVAGILGYTKRGTYIAGCTNSLSMSVVSPSRASIVGGICGEAGSDGVIVRQCMNRGEISATGYVGGDFGGICAGFGLITDCVNEGNVINHGTYAPLNTVAGISGYIWNWNGVTVTTFDNCHNRGNVQNGGANNTVGGIAGDLAAAQGEIIIINCSNSGVIGGGDAQAAGGVVGKAWAGGGYTIENCWNSGDVTGAALYAGGIGGYLEDVALANCYSSSLNVTGGTVGAIIGGANLPGGTTMVLCYWHRDFVGTFSSGVGIDAGIGTGFSGYIGDLGTFGDPDYPGEGGLIIYFGKNNDQAGFLYALNNWAQNDPTTYLEWTLDGSHTGYPVFGPEVVVPPQPDPYVWYFWHNTVLNESFITNAVGWQLQVDMDTVNKTLSVIHAEHPDTPYPMLDFNGRIEDDYTIVSIGNGACNILGDKSGFDAGKGASMGAGGMLLPLTLTNIAAKAFEYALQLFEGELVIPDSVVSIGMQAFVGVGARAGGPSTLVLETSASALTAIGSWAFECSLLTGNLIIPDSVVTIGDGAFNSCGFYGYLWLGTPVSPRLQTIGAHAFAYNNFMLGFLTIPDSVVTIGNYAFAQSQLRGKLTLESVQSSLTTIGDYAFWGNELNDNLLIPDSVVTIGKCAFADNGFRPSFLIHPTLTLETVKSSLTTIGESAFTGNTFWGDLTIPDSVVTIGNSAFANTEFAGSLTLETTASSLTTIGASAFYNGLFWGCPLTIPDSVITIGDNAFAENRFYGFLTLGNSVETIGGGAFAFSGDYSGLNYEGSTLAFPDSVQTVGPQAFAGCTFVTVSSWGTLDTITEGMFQLATFTTGTFVIADQITEIASSAFGFITLGIGCTFAGDVIIGDGVTAIGNYAFTGCDGITRISAPSTDVDLGFRSLSSIDSLQGVYYRAKATAYAADIYQNSLAVVSYVHTEYTNNWNPEVAYAPITGNRGDAEWQDRDILCIADWPLNSPFPDRHTVTLVSDFGTPKVQTVLVATGQMMPDVTPPHSGPTEYFQGYTNELGNIYYFGTGKGARTWDKHTDGTLYAVWYTANQPVITYYGNGGTPSLQTVVHSGIYYTPPPPPTWPDSTHVFDGWNSSPDGKGIPVIDQETRFGDFLEECFVYATWKRVGGPGPDEEIPVFINSIDVSPEGNVTLQWGNKQVKDAFGAGASSYKVLVSTNLVNWDETPALDTRDIGGTDDSVNMANATLPPSTKRFFKVIAVK